MKMTELTQLFNEAIEAKAKYVAVRIQMEDFPEDEIIINPNENIVGKLAYYEKTYDENCVHKFSPTIKITGAGYSNYATEILHKV